MAAITYRHRTSDGQVFERRSARKLTHVVEDIDARKAEYGDQDWTFDGVAVVSWHARHDLAAEKVLERRRWHGKATQARVVEINGGKV